MTRWLTALTLASATWIGAAWTDEAEARHWRRGGTSVFVDIDVGAYGFYRRPLSYYSPAFGHGWRRGYWRHDWYGGRYGWWWVVGPSNAGNSPNRK